MIWKKIFLMAAWYVWWLFIWWLYNKKSPEDLKKDMKCAKEKWECDMKVFLASFIDTHRNLLLDLEKEILSDKNKELFNKKKEEILKIATEYREKWNELLEEVKVKWKDFIVEALEKLEKLYNEKKDELDTIKEISPKKIKELKDNLKGAYTEISKKIKSKINKKD